MIAASPIIAPSRRETSAAVDAGASSMPNTSSVPTDWKELMIATATTMSINVSNRRTRNPDVAASSGWMHSSRNGRRHTQATTATNTRAIDCQTTSFIRTPSSSPNRMRVRSPVKLLVRDVIMTPSASMPAKNNPIAVSLDRRDRRVITLTPLIITTVPAAAPITTGQPRSTAVAMPGRTPWARASATKARPRSTTNEPTIAQHIATSTPAESARVMKSLSMKGLKRKSVMRW